MGTRIKTSATGIDRTTKKIAKIDPTIRDEMKREVMKLMKEIGKEATTYPAETRGNRPPPPYWSRGVGRVQSYKDKKPNPKSEKLGDADGRGENFSYEIGGNQFGVSGKMTNTITYAPWVLGDEHQAYFHRFHGWRTIGKVILDLGLTGSGESDRWGEVTGKIFKRIEGLFNE